MEVKNNELKKRDIVVCVWGATMLLADFGEVVSVSPKSVVIESIKSCSAKDKTLPVNYGCPWVVPMEDEQGYVRETERYQHGAPKKIRLYKKTLTHSYGPSEEVWFSKKQGFKKYFVKWDGKPVQEDHND